MIGLIETERLLIRRLELSDSKPIFLLSQEASLREWIPDQVYNDENEAKQVLKFLISQYKNFENPKEKPLVLAIVSKNKDEVIGHVGLSPLKDKIEIGYSIGEKECGQGLASEVVSAVSKWAISMFPIQKIYGIVDSNNEASCRVLEKSGYSLEKEAEQMHHKKISMCKTYFYK